MGCCNHFSPAPMNRREMLRRCGGGFGAVALAALLGDRAFGATAAERKIASAAAKSLGMDFPNFTPKARNVIFLYMDGGVSQIDSFDPKPLLTKEDGQPFKMKMEQTQFDNNGSTLGSPWAFKHYGQSGIEVSDLFPHVAECVDDLAIIRSMVSNFSEHNAANYFLHSGHGTAGRPSMGAWATYGLGSENQNLPGFVVLNGGLIPSGGLDNFSSGFLPAAFQASILRTKSPSLANVVPSEPTPQIQRNKLDLMRQLDQAGMERMGELDPLESAIANYELAFKMQTAVPEATDLAGESDATKRLYGLESDDPHTRAYGEQCLVARRLLERGVRFIEMTCPRIGNNDRWDAHGRLRQNHGENAHAVDQPIAGLLKDLKALGLLSETLVVWSGEFGRTPFAQGRDGRDHNPFGFSIWLAGAGIKGGTVFGSTDEYGYKVVENKVEIHDLHATMLHLLGVDHKKLTYRYSGRDMRLTDVFGNVVHDILA